MKNKIDITSYDAVIFDLDGTLIDSMGVWSQIDIDFLGKRGFDVPEDYMDKITPMGFEATAEYTIERFCLNEKKDDIIKEWYDMAIEAYSNHVVLKPGVKEYLNYLRENNKKMCVATASDMMLVKPVLCNNGISEYFDNITTVSEVSKGKGFPDIYDRAADKMIVQRERCIVFEDILEGVRGAKAGNYVTIGVFDSHSSTKSCEFEKICDRYIKDFREMM